MNSSHRKADWTTVMFTLATSCLVCNLFRSGRISSVYIVSNNLSHFF